MFGHEKLDVYKLAIRYIAFIFTFTDYLSGKYRHTRDQWIRALQSIPLNFAQGNDKSSKVDRRRFFDIALRSSLECAAIQDVLEVVKGISTEENKNGKEMLDRIVAILIKLK